ncbi:MAG: nitrite/sulfite reductase [Melioribacter sp.]|uniref:nitrite/sulfite reductase n=1 Tax=Rosettibacter primus TaxID=3111523 RepID=UPI00247C0C5F|nr:nitrite/sulfite reductase [Melioribacter sp.]
MTQVTIWEQIDINRGYDVYSEINEYEEIINKLKAGEIHPERFKGYRLTFGTYGVRHHGEGIHMQRIKIPSGFILSEQIRQIASITEKYVGSGHAHLTTRQDIQLHFIKIEDIPVILRMLADVGITTKEACGNCVRNITASYLSGINPNEYFDILPYSIFCTRYFLRHPLTSTLPRKFKISFSESEEDFALSRIHDIGCIAQVKNNGKEEYGFRIYVGGGLGSVPMTSNLLFDFIPVTEFYPLAEAILRVFHKYGTEERNNRNKARMKFLIARIGFDNFKELVAKEFEVLKKFRQIDDELKEYVNNFPLPAPTKNGKSDGPENTRRLKNPIYQNQNVEIDPLWKTFLNKYLIKQKQTGYYAIWIKPPLGNITPDKLRLIADFSDLYGAGYMKISPTQKLLIPWVEEKFLQDTFLYLKENGLIGGTTEAMHEIVSCPGAFSCRLAVTHPYNFAEYIGKNIDDLNGLRIHISGCPNSCGQHHIGDLGFFGASLKIDGKLSPHYVVLIGGNVFHQRTRIGQVIGKVPAAAAPLFVKEVIDFWKNQKQNGEQFFEFVDRVGIDSLRRILSKYSKVPQDNPEYFHEPYIDEEFKMEAETRGECAGSLLDIMAINLYDSMRNIYEAEDDIKAENWSAVKSKCFDSLLKCSKMYVYLEGIEPQNEEEILTEFVNRIVPKHWLCNDWSNIKDNYFIWKHSSDEKEIALRIFDYTKRFVEDSDKSYLRLLPNLKIMECAKITGEEDV